VRRAPIGTFTRQCANLGAATMWSLREW
jgi:hypothetical protein